MNQTISIEILIDGVVVGFIGFEIILGNVMFPPKHGFE
jgi:hypothetical protein